MAVRFETHRFSVEQYERMVEAGVLTPDDRVELLAGEIVVRPPMSPEHATVVGLLANALRPLEHDERAVVREQHAVRLPPDSEPEPDIALVAGPRLRYLHRHPEPDDIFLVVEVGFATLLADRNGKIPVYASAGVSEAWLVDGGARRIEVYTEPTPEGYGRVEVVYDYLAPQTFPEHRVSVADVIP